MASYFRSVGEPALCRLARSGELYPGPVEHCPCGGPRCQSVPQAATWWEYTRQQHGKALAIGGAALAAGPCFCCAWMLLREDPLVKEVTQFRTP